MDRMIGYTQLMDSIERGAYDAVLESLYTPERVPETKTRIKSLAEQFRSCFTGESFSLFSAPGRTEIGGNHTDHQHGRVLCGSLDLDILAFAAPNETEIIRIHSKGYPDVSVNLNELQPKQEEINTTSALVRGVAAAIRQRGYEVKGFDACITSDVLPGSGMSSSAAFEVLIGTIINQFFCGGSLEPVEIAKIGQHAENIYFGKPCGLMDQMASAIGGVVAIDFTDVDAPFVRKVDVDFSEFRHALCIIDTGSGHADLTDDYADITREMGAAAAFFGKNVLREVDEETFRVSIPALRECCGDRAVLRALHFYEDDRRAAEEASALEQGNFGRFLELVRASGQSSALYLQNNWSPSDPSHQAIPLTLAIGERLLAGEGAIRVHGGGFAGTVQAFVPVKKVEQFKAGMDSLLGAGKCRVLQIRSVGGCTVID